MKTSKTLSGRTRLILWWPLFLIPIIAALAVVVKLLNEKAFTTTLIFAGIYIAFVIWWMIYWRKKFAGSILEFSDTYNAIYEEQIENHFIPMALIDETGCVIWENDAFSKIFIESGKKHEEIADVFPEIGKEFLKNINVEFKIGNKEYKAEFRRSKAADNISVLSLIDLTKQKEQERIIDELHPVVATVVVDNYDEVINSTESLRKPMLSALIEKKISQYFDSASGITSETSKESFVIYLNNKGINKLKEDKFSILESVKKISYGNRVHPTLSIGIGIGSDNIVENSKYSNSALDMALGRGGDQAIIKTQKDTVFFGGKSEQTEKATRVKIRVFSQAFRELLLTKKKVFVMGHVVPDADALASAIGIYRIAKSLGKEAQIIMKDVPEGMKPLYAVFAENEPDMFIDHERAKSGMDEDTVLVVTDVNRPSICECPGIIKKAKSIVVIDHHRRGDETIQNATLSYVETFASSASEIITEMIEYAFDEDLVDENTAMALYSGIVIDTDNFNTRTGQRTFEAAAFLRKKGADIARARKLFRTDVNSFMAKVEAVRTLELYKEHYAFGVCNSEELSNASIVGAMVANELLDINNVKASFVFTPVKEKIFISARSIDEVNVQIILEKIGGGGHLSVAGAQLEGYTLEDAIEQIKQIIDRMIKEGEI